MNAKQLIEAAKDYINWSLPLGHPDRGFCKWRLSDDETARRHRDEACEAMASHILATVRPDDDEPVNDHALQADGWYPWSEYWRHKDYSHFVSINEQYPATLWMCIGTGVCRVKSMGHLRRLVAALGE